MLVLISVFPVLLVNPVNRSLGFVAVIRSKPGIEMDYKNPLIHFARYERYSEVIKNENSLLNHCFTYGIIFLKIALFNFNNSLLQSKTFHMKKSNLEKFQLKVKNAQRTILLAKHPFTIIDQDKFLSHFQQS